MTSADEPRSRADSASKHRLRLFDPIPLSGGYSGRNEPTFSYLNRSSRAEASRVRLKCQEWFDHYPANEAPRLWHRFRSVQEPSHAGAAFELVLHEFLRRANFSLLPEPSLSDETPKRPDFVAMRDGKRSFVIEARVAMGETDDKRSSVARRNAVLDALNSISNDRFCIDVHVCDVNGEIPDNLAFDFDEYLASVSEDDFIQSVEQHLRGDYRRTTFSSQGLRLVFSLVPLPPGYRKGSGIVRIVGMDSFEQVRTGMAFKQAIQKKVPQRYGVIDMPFVVAVNTMSWGVTEFELFEALFGTLRFPFTFQADGSHIAHPAIRDSAGLFSGKNANHFTGVSAVLAFDRTNLWNLGRSRVVLLKNPWAAHPLGDALDTIERYDVVDGAYARIPGPSLGEILDLPKEWPE